MITTAPFTMPAAGSSTAIFVNDTTTVGVGQAFTGPAGALFVAAVLWPGRVQVTALPGASAGVDVPAPTTLTASGWITSANSPYTVGITDAFLYFMGDATSNPSAAPLVAILPPASSFPDRSITFVRLAVGSEQARQAPHEVTGTLVEDINTPGTYGSVTTLRQWFGQRATWQSDGTQWSLLPGS